MCPKPYACASALSDSFVVEDASSQNFHGIRSGWVADDFAQRSCELSPWRATDALHVTACRCRERNDGCYTALTYLSAKIVEEALVALVQSIVFACIVFFPCEFTGSFALFWYTYFQTTLIGIREPPAPHSRHFL